MSINHHEAFVGQLPHNGYGSSGRDGTRLSKAVYPEGSSVMLPLATRATDLENRSADLPLGLMRIL